MVTVPIYERQTRLAPVSGQGVDVRAPAGAFGGQIADATGRLGGTIGKMGQVLEDHRDKMDEAAAKRADVEFADFEREALYGAEGLFGKQGMAAVEQAPAVEKALREKARDLAGGARGEQQRQMIEGVLTQRVGTAADGIARHRLQSERQEYVDSSNARLYASGQLAAATYWDGEAQKQAIATGLAELDDLAEEFAWSPEVKVQKRLEWLTGVHGEVLGQLITQDPAAAEAYFNKNLGDMNAQTRAAYGGRIAQAVTRRTAATRALAAWEASGGNIAQAYAAGRDLPPEQYLEFQQTVDVLAARADRVKTQGKEDAFMQLAGMIQQGTPFAALPDNLLALVPDQLPALRNLEEAATKGSTPAKSGAAYLLALAQSAESPEAFKRLDVLSLAGQAHPDELVELLKTQRTMRASGGESAISAGYKLAYGIAAPMMGAYGANDTAKGRPRRDEIRASIMSLVQAKLAQGQTIDEKVAAEIVKLAFLPSAQTAGRPVAQQRIFAENRVGQSIIPSASDLMATAPGLWDQTTFALRAHRGVDPSTGKTALVGNEDVAEAMAYYEATGYTAMVRYRDIPVTTREAYEDMMRRRGVKVSKAEVERAYTQELLARTPSR